MFRPVKMSKVNILVLSKYVTETTRLLGQMGKIHLVDAVSQSNGHLLKEAESPTDCAVLEKLTVICDRLVEGLGLDATALQDTEENDEDMSLEDMSALLNRIAARYSKQETAIEEQLRATGATDRERSAIASFPLQQVPIDALKNLSHFFMVTGRMAPTAAARAMLTLGDDAIIVQADGDEENVLVLSSNKKRFAVRDELNKYGFIEVSAPENVNGTAEEAVNQLNEKLLKIRSILEECRQNVLKLGAEFGAVILLMQRNLKCHRAVQAAQSHFGCVAHVYCISGWAPTSEIDKITEVVKATTGGTGIVETINPEDDPNVQAGLESVPVKFQGGTWLSPFHGIISNFGVPRYNELDTSIFVALTFVILFGFMFGDIGQGALLALAGLYLKRTKRQIDDTLRSVGILLLLCGCSSVFFGFCYGSVFCYENHEVLKPLWLSPLKQENIMKLLLTTVGVGIVFSSVAIIINIINHFRARKFFDGIFDRFGLLGLMFYWFVLLSGLWMVFTKSIPVWGIVMIAIPLVLLFFRGALAQYAFKHSGEKEGIMNLVLEAIIELMETFTGYLSGTVSFVRVGAFAISHAALSMAVFKIVGMMENLPGSIILKLLIIILGNALIIGFEGMVVMIQCIRLEYYELFGKYFEGGGTEYKPFKLKK